MKIQYIEINGYYTLKATGETVRVDKMVGDDKYEVWTQDAQEAEVVTARQLGPQLMPFIEADKTVWKSVS